MREAANFGPLRRWVALQAASNPTLADVRQAAVSAGELPPPGAQQADLALMEHLL